MIKELFLIYSKINFLKIGQFVGITALISLCLYLYTSIKEVEQKVNNMNNKIMIELEYNERQNSFKSNLIKKELHTIKTELEALKPKKKGVLIVKNGKKWVKQCVLY